MPPVILLRNAMRLLMERWSLAKRAPSYVHVQGVPVALSSVRHSLAKKELPT